MKKILFLSLLGFVGQTFADGNVAKMGLQMPGAAPFEILKAAFERAEPSQINDYPKIADLNTTRSNLKCVSSVIRTQNSQPQPEVMGPALIGRFDYIIPGTPDNGPLFPGKPDEVVTVLSMVLSSPTENSTVSDSETIVIYNSNNFQMPVSSISATGDLQMSVTSTNNSMLATTVYRKKGTELNFHEIIDMPGDKYSAEGYGYCYPRAN